jgi:(p)ppGpp synthase/HD superfamily hydrolase
VKTNTAKVIVFAAEKHKGQLDDEGKDYFEAHCCQVAMILAEVAPSDLELIQAALLHDTLEDTETSYKELVENFGARVADLVAEVTHEGKKDEKGYYFPRLKTREGIMLKFADRLSNLSRMSSWPATRQDQYLRKSKFWKSE